MLRRNELFIELLINTKGRFLLKKKLEKFIDKYSEAFKFNDSIPDDKVLNLGVLMSQGKTEL